MIMMYIIILTKLEYKIQIYFISVRLSIEKCTSKYYSLGSNICWDGEFYYLINISTKTNSFKLKITQSKIHNQLRV